MALITILHRLAQLRRELEEERRVHDVAEEAVMRTPEYVAMGQSKARLHFKLEAIKSTEEIVRSFAIGAYEDSGNKHPVPGITIKLFTRLQYETECALEWCKAYAPMMVREVLDTKRFEKVATNLIGAPVEVVIEPRPYIDADLSNYLVEDIEHATVER